MTISLPLVASGSIKVIFGLDPPTLKVLTDLTAALTANAVTPADLQALAALRAKADSLDPSPGASHVSSQ